MSRFLKVDPLGGASGDMFLAALIDLGADAQRIQDDLGALKLNEGFRIIAQRDTSRGFEGVRVRVKLRHGEAWVSPENSPVIAEAHTHPHAGDHAHAHNHADTHAHNHADTHAHNHADTHAHSHGHHRTFAQIREMLLDSGLPSRVVERSLCIFQHLAEAEGRVHGKPADEVHFHEVGAVDSVVDIVGTALAMEQLDIDDVFSTAVGVAQGFVNCAHGQLPLPAPATQWLLKDCPTIQQPEKKELCTPTGAAILKAMANFSLPTQSMSCQGIGMGLSHRTPQHAPPFLRIILLVGDEQKLGTVSEDWVGDQIVRLSCDIDDLRPEFVPRVIEAVMDVGALDAAASSILMKKGRAGMEFRVLCALEKEREVVHALMLHSTTFGVRRELIDRYVLKRRMETVATPWGDVRVKLSSDSRYHRFHVEYEDVLSASRRHGISCDEVVQWVHREASH